MDEYLFVYGSLMRPFESSMRRFLEDNSIFTGEGQVFGILYDLGRYPGLVLDASADRQVTGHIFKLESALKILQVLDKYEGIDPLHPTQGEYRREQRTVQLPTVGINCWMYLYNLPVNDLSEIPFGNYVDYAMQNEAHQRFISSV